MGSKEKKSKKDKKDKKDRRARKDGKGARRKESRASQADRYALYQQAVQAPDVEAALISGFYEEIRGRSPVHLREDFCGTAFLASRWVVRGSGHTAEAYDIDPEPLAWGRRANLDPLGADADRVVLHTEDVRRPSRKSPDIRVAFNFSYRTFKARQELLEYFRAVRQDLAPEGIFVLDSHGGSDTTVAMEERRRVDKGVRYVWEQVDYHPVSGEYFCRMHFDFKDGSRIEDAFVYDWRLWGLPELRDLLLEAGFSAAHCYWEGTDEDGLTGNGEFKISETGENCLSWIAYLVAPA